MPDSLKQNLIEQQRIYTDSTGTIQSEISSRTRTTGQPWDCWNCKGIGKIKEWNSMLHLCPICFGAGKLYA